MALEFQHNNIRASKARFAHLLDSFLRKLLVVLVILLLLAGAGLLVAGMSLGWLVASLAAIPAMISEWSNGELKRLAPARKENPGIADVLDGEVLGKLPVTPTLKDIATIVGQTSGGQFFGARFGVTARLLQDIADQDGLDINSFWADAMELKDELEFSDITPGIAVVALVKQLPHHEAVLAHLHIDLNDLKQGLLWQKRLRLIIDEHKKPRRTGGIARDWSFGYIPTLNRFGRNLAAEVSGGLLTVETASHQKAISEMVSLFGSSGGRNVLLTGPTGAGKTTLVYAFAEHLLDASANLPSSLKFHQIFMLDASRLIAAAPGRGELEQLMDHLLGEAYGAKNIIICLDDAQLFFEDGIGSVDLSNMLLPILEAGRLPMILTMDEQRFLKIAQRNAGVANALNRIIVEPTGKAETIEVLETQLIMTEFSKRVTYTYQSLVESFNLSERYIHDVAMPGQAIKLIESAARFNEAGLITINSIQAAIEQTTGIKVSVASEADDREKLLNLEGLIHERMINQERAVGVVSDALRRARAGVRNRDRPIGTFLFLGPTGVGKTELAKALASVYFGGEDRLIRLDLNEFVRNEDVARLIADGASDPTSLTAQVMKQPFSVVLLDEIEKAHPNVLTTLLQLLDEGILRDINNREVSFRDAIVIATSNAGADRIREYVLRGYGVEQFEQEFINELISSNQFRPEFLNRFDEIVTFGPLSKVDLLKVVDLMIQGVNKTLQPQKVSVSVMQDAKELLVDRGYDPRLGARPMRRVVQRAVENTVAKLMLGGQVQPGQTIEITKEQVEQILGSAETASAIISSST